MTKRERRYHNRKTWWEEFQEIDRAFWDDKMVGSGRLSPNLHTESNFTKTINITCPTEPWLMIYCNGESELINVKP